MSFKLLTVKEVAAMFGVPETWIYERTRRRGVDQLPHVKLGRYIRFEESAVAEYLHRQRKAYLTRPYDY